MAAPVKPALVRAYGNTSWGFVTTVANIQAPTLTELTAVSGFNLSCSVFGDQGGVDVTDNKVTLPRLLCETQTYEVAGESSYSMSDLTVSLDQQAATGADGRKAWDALTDQLNGFLWWRVGLAASADLVVAQTVNIVPGQLGTKVPIVTANDASGVSAFKVSYSITSKPAFLVAVAA